jgi:two-component system, cell cycle response regulator
MAKVLVIDDDRVARAALGTRLSAMDHMPIFASDGINAIATAERELPDLVLLDLGLPTGDAFDVIERLHAIPGLGYTPVIVFSASDPDIYRDRALQAGAVEFFEKRSDLLPLLQAVQRAVGGELPE